MKKIIINSFILFLFVTKPIHAFDKIRLFCEWQNTGIDYVAIEHNEEKMWENNAHKFLYRDFSISISPKDCFFLIGFNPISRNLDNRGEPTISDNKIECKFETDPFFQEKKSSEKLLKDLEIKISSSIKNTNLDFERYTGNSKVGYYERTLGMTNNTSDYANYKREHMMIMDYICRKEAKKF